MRKVLLGFLSVLFSYGAAFAHQTPYPQRQAFDIIAKTSMVLENLESKPLRVCSYGPHALQIKNTQGQIIAQLVILDQSEDIKCHTVPAGEARVSLESTGGGDEKLRGFWRYLNE